MTDRFRTLGVWTVVAVFLVVGGCSRGPARVKQPGIDAGAAGQAALDQYDTNKDGKIAGDELDAAASLKSAMDRLDLDKDGAVTAEEVTKRIEIWQESKLGLTNMTVTVTYGGRPVEGAKVVLEPEAFLGTNLKPAGGTTDGNGLAGLRIEGNKRPGVAVGFYKVKITKDGMTIPAKYNEQTTLGAEIAPDMGEAMESGLLFNLM